jgi:multidrug transporter EmrE-like cation transporter
MKIKFAAIFGLAFCSVIHAQIPTDGLVAYFPFNGNASDASGNGNSGTVYGATLTNDRYSVPNSAYFFDGASSYILVSNSPSLSLTNITISLWVKPAPGFTVPCYFLQKHEAYDNDDGSWWLGIHDAHLAFQATPYFDEITASLSLPSINQWTQCVFTYDNPSGNWAFYLNGRLDSSGTRTFNLQPTTWPLLLGAELQPDGVSLNYFYYGAMNDIRIYNHALSGTEVQRLYQIEGAPKIKIINLTNDVTISFANLAVGTDYQLQVSTDLNSWTNFGAAFTATNSFMIYTNNWNVSDWNQLFFRLH